MTIQEEAQILVQQAMLALSRHQESEAKALARQAAQMAPELESVWLVMAAVSSPRAAEVYLQKALEINPKSEQAREGLDWVRKNQGAVTGAYDPDNPLALPPIPLPRYPEHDYVTALDHPGSFPMDIEMPVNNVAETSQMEIEPLQIPYPPQAVFPQPETKKTSTRSKGSLPDYQNIEATRLYTRKVVWWPWLLVVMSICLGAAVWMVLPPMQVASASDLHAVRQQGEIVKPSHTPTPTATSTPTPTPTNTPMPSPTPTETPTSMPTDTPEPEEEWEADYVYSIEKLPSVGKSERWIDVDLSSQTVAAYQGKELIISFLVSTGTSAHPTVTGRYHIYVKYRYTDMAGPGYYLPDVPYTMYFHDGYGLHGTYWHSNFGTPMSHGCINLRTEDAAWLYDWASVGTLVNVHY